MTARQKNIESLTKIKKYLMDLHGYREENDYLTLDLWGEGSRLQKEKSRSREFIEYLVPEEYVKDRDTTGVYWKTSNPDCLRIYSHLISHHNGDFYDRKEVDVYLEDEDFDAVISAMRELVLSELEKKDTAEFYAEQERVLAMRNRKQREKLEEKFVELFA